VLLFLLTIGGALTTLLVDGENTVLPVLQQSSDPEASVSDAEPWQAEQLFLLVLVIVGSLVGIAGGTALVMWFMDRQVRNIRAAEAAQNDGKKPARAGRKT
jgi:hypothetical protein